MVLHAEALLRIPTPRCLYPVTSPAAADFAEDLKKAMKRSNLMALYRETTKFYDSGDYPRALSTLERVLELAPELGEVWAYKGTVLRNLGRYSEALVALERALERAPDSPLAWRAKATLLHELGHYEEALSAIGRALGLGPEESDAWVAKADLLYELGRAEEALATSVQALKLEPKNALAWAIRGTALVGLRRYDEALSALERAIKLEPEDALPLAIKGAALVGLKRHDEALVTLEQAMKLGPEGAIACWANKGIALYSLGRVEEAMEWLDQGLDSISNPRVRGEIYNTWGLLTLLQAQGALARGDREAVEDWADQWGYIMEQARDETLGEVLEQRLTTFKAALSPEAALKFARLKKKLRQMEDPQRRFKALQDRVTRKWPAGLSIVEAVREDRQ